MNTRGKLKLKLKMLLSAICAVCLCCATFMLVFGDIKSAQANSSVAGGNASVKQIYDYDNSCYSESNLNQLASQILGGDKTIKDLETAALNAGTAGMPIENSRYVTVAYGKYGSTLEQKYNSPRELSWIPVYMSRSNEGHAILTLYLDGTYSSSTAVSRMEDYAFTSNATWSETNSDTAPSSSYGTSYMRAFVLGNGGTYYTYNPNHKGATTTPGNAIINESDANKFLDFVQSIDSNGDTIDGIFYADIVTPSHIAWQEKESYAASIGQWEVGKDYNFPNEAYGTPSKGTFINNNTLGYGNRRNYNVWKDDKVWLPSLTEVGTGDLLSNSDERNGIWRLTADERANNGGNSWLRTAYTAGTNPNPYTMFCTTANGNGYTTSTVNVKNAVRPAIHVDITAISKKTVPPLNVPDTIEVTYNGQAQTQASLVDLPWYDASAIAGVNFFSDEKGLHVTTPRDAGEYYIEIELNSLTSKYFIGEDPTTKVKIFKFVINKAKLAVQWVYGSDADLNSQGGLVPTDIKLVEETNSGLGKIYEWDIEKEKVPVVGMKYYSQATGGPQGITDYPDVKGQYTAKPYIIGEDEYNYNYEIDEALCKAVSLEMEPDKLDSERCITYESWIFLVTERKIPIPVFSNDTASLKLNYRGWQEVQIYNVTKYITIDVESSFEYEAKEPDYENGIQTFLVEAVGKYTFKANIIDKDNIVWRGEDDQYRKTETKELELGIEKVLVTVTFTGLLPSWEASRSVDVTLNLLGLYSDDSEINIEAVIQGTNWPEMSLKITEGKVTIPSGLAVGKYTFTIRMLGNNPYYYMSDQVHQDFEIVTSPAAFTDDNVVWQYKTGNSSATNPVNGDHSTADKAIEVPYTGNYYQFNLTLSETRLAQMGVRATYSGDTRVTDGGEYCVIVTISAYDRNVTFETKSYKLYFNVTKALFDLSGLQWDYTSPFEYSGDEYRVTLKAGTLPAGLSVTYITNGSYTNTATEAGTYSTSAEFSVLPEYAANYTIPVSDDRTTFKGDYPPVCNWQITQKIITVSWKDNNASSDLFFVPVLEVGDNLVDYTYEIFQNGDWVAAESVVSPDTGSSQYRVTAQLKAIYQANYYLYDETETYYHEFVVDSGKQAVTVHIEINDVKCDDGQKFTYTGSEFTAKPIVESGSLDVNDFTVKYYAVDANGNKSSVALESAPVNVGKYCAVIDVTFGSSDNSYISDESETEVYFEITKADYDTSGLFWQYIHNNVVIIAHFNVNQGKWLDDDGNDVVFSFEYDGDVHQLNLVGVVEGLEWELTDVSKTNAGEYTASVEFKTDGNHNAPANFPITLGWKITKAKVKLDNVQWGYTDQYGVEHEFDFYNDTLPYTRGANGDINYTVGLINLPREIKDFFVYQTYYYNDDETWEGNSSALIGVYRTSFSISIPPSYDPGENYEAFTASEMPSYISSSQVWEITARELTKPSFTGGWEKFDNTQHYLLDMCGIPEEEINFFDVEITFTDTAGRIYRDYQGYDDQKYTGFHAGKYIVTFYRIVGSDKVYWGAVEFEIGKDLLIVTWDNTGTIPVARVEGVYVSDMLETVYTNGAGEEKTPQYILTTDGVTFYAEPRVTSEYAHNIGFEMKSGEVDRYVFTSTKFTPNSETKYLPKPEMLVSEQEWTGSPITFAVGMWAGTYYGYLYLSEGSLTQTAVGEYKVTFSFVKNSNACWEGTTGNRDSVTLTFSITRPQIVPLDKPVLQFDSIVYTGAPISFSIVNWPVYSQYLKQAEGSDNLTQTEPGTYRVTLEFINSAGCWKDGSRDTVTLEFTIKPQRAQLSKPSLVYTWAYFTGNDITFEINRWADHYSNYLAYSGDSLTQTEVGKYSITFSFKDGVNACWESGDTNEFTLYYEIKMDGDKYPVGPSTVLLNKPTMINAKQDYTGSAITFEIANWSELSKYLTYTGSLTQTEPNTYFVTLSFKDGVDACWKDTETQSEYRLSFTIEKDESDNPPPDDAQYITKPFLTLLHGDEAVTQIEWKDSPITVEIFNWNYYQEYLQIKSGSNPLNITAPGTYSVVVGFRPVADKYYWEGTTDRSDVTLTVVVSKIPAGTTALPHPVIDNPKVEYTGEKLYFTITNWNDISHYVSIQDVLNYDYVNGTLGGKALGTVSGGTISLDSTEVGHYAVVVRIKPTENAVWEDGSKEDFVLYFEVTKAVLTDAYIDDSGSLHLKSDKADSFDALIDKLLKEDVIGYEYKDSSGNIVNKEDLVEGEDYSVKLVIKDKTKFDEYFETDQQVEEKLDKTYDITYTPEKQGEDLNKILLVSSICLGVEVILFIILIIVYSKKKKALEEDDADEE